MSWKYDWNLRTDVNGKPSGYFVATPFPVDETMLTYDVENDDGVKTYTLGSVYFIDNSAGVVNGTTTYDPVARTNTGGAFTCYTSLVNALSAHTSTSGQNKTFLVRDGTYTNTNTYSLTNHWGVDDTHRFSFIGYKQERPILDGGGASANMFGGGNAGDAQFESYFTLQRLKLTNRVGEGVYIGRDTVGMKRCQYVYLIDLWFYQCAYSSDAFDGTCLGSGTTTMTSTGAPAWTVDEWIGYYLMNATKQAANTGTVFYSQIVGNTEDTITTSASLGWDDGDTYYVAKQVNGSVYYLNADHGWINHCTLERTMGHGVKVGDGSAGMTLEWNLIKENGWWPAMALPYHLSRTVGIDFPNDAGKDAMIGNIARYNIMTGCGSHGFQMRGVPGLIAHHNEITNWGNMYATIGYIGGVTAAGVYAATTNPCYGTIYSNKVHTPADAAVGYVVNDGRSSETSDYYNNLFYWNSDNMAGVLCYTSGGASRLLNNTIDCTTSGIGASLSRSTDEFSNNIVYQRGTGKAAVFGASTVHSYNVAYAPSGSLGFLLAATEVNADPVFASASNWNIQVTSPAKGSAQDLSAIFTIDISDSIRVVPWDIGAYGYGIAPPGAPSSLSATAISTSVISIAWTNNATDATGIKVERSADNSTFVEIGDIAPTDTTYNATGLASGTQYWFRVRAYNTNGYSAYSNTANDTTDAAPVLGAGNFPGSSMIGLF